MAWRIRRSATPYPDVVHGVRVVQGDYHKGTESPTLIFVGDADRRTPVSDAEALSSSIPNAFMKVVRNCGHYYTYEQPELVGRVARMFLEAF